VRLVKGLGKWGVSPVVGMVKHKSNVRWDTSMTWIVVIVRDLGTWIVTIAKEQVEYPILMPQWMMISRYGTRWA
jgi:hypothetical protein